MAQASKKKLTNNYSLANNVEMFTGFLSGKRVLVLERNLSSLDVFNVKDFYDAVLIEDLSALSTVTDPDFIFYKSESSYENFVLKFDQLFEFTKSIQISNFKAVQQFEKLGRTLDAFNANYLPSDSVITSTPSIEREIACGLNIESPAVHFAYLMGCSTIYYTGVSSFATTVTYNDIAKFTTDLGRYTYLNLIKPGRDTVLIELL